MSAPSSDTRLPACLRDAVNDAVALVFWELPVVIDTPPLACAFHSTAAGPGAASGLPKANFGSVWAFAAVAVTSTNSATRTLVQARQRRAATGTFSRHSGHAFVAGAAAGFAPRRWAAPTTLTITTKTTKATTRKSTAVPNRSPIRK